MIAAISRLHRCLIGSTLLFSLAVMLLITAVSLSCSQVRIAAINAIKNAEVAGEEAEKLGVTRDMAASYQQHMSRAKEAYEKKKYKKARLQADMARTAAETLAQMQKELRDRIQKLLKELWTTIETDPFPPRALVEACFAAQKAFDEGRYKEAEKIIEEARNRQAIQLRVIRRDEVIIKAPDEYFEQHDGIPLYDKVDKSGNPGKVLEETKETTHAKFLKSRWVSPMRRFVKVKIGTGDESHEVWVKGKFVF